MKTKINDFMCERELERIRRERIVSINVTLEK
jgi:hypothetical protein